jgi:hypothetical protein
MASKRKIRRKECSGKRRYASREIAQRAVSRLKMNTKDTSYLKIYKCRWCSGWHFGHAPGSGRVMSGRRHR